MCCEIITPNYLTVGKLQFAVVIGTCMQDYCLNHLPSVDRCQFNYFVQESFKCELAVVVMLHVCSVHHVKFLRQVSSASIRP